MRSLAVPTFILTAATVTATPAFAGITSNWVGPNGGLWNNAANWSAGVPGSPGVPNGSITVRRGTMTVNLNTSPSMGGLTIGEGCTLSQPNDVDFALTSLVNDGVWAVSSAGNITDIRLNADMSFLGSGVMDFSNNGNNRITSINAARTLTNGADHTIRGAGQIGTNNTGLVNDGLIEATLPSGLFIDLADNLPLDNNNLLRARDGSTLSIYGTNTDNSGGVIRAEDASTVLFRFGSVTGGALETTGSGEFRTTTEDTTFIDVTLNGLFRMPNDADTVLAGTLTNNGTWAMDSAGNITDLKLNSPSVTLDGPGIVAMSDNGNNRITSINAARTLVNGASHTIRGAGQIGTNNTGLVNDGLIEATLPSGLFIDLADNLPLDNNNLLRARDGSTLSIYGTVTDNTDGVIRAEDASTVLFRFGSVTGGALETTGSGEFRTTTEDTTFVDVTLNGLFRMPNDADTVLAGTLTNNGTWAMDSAGNITDLKLNSPSVTLDGPGIVAMSNNGNNRITSINAARTLVNGASHTIRGAGQIGTNNTGLVNDGLIEATLPSGLFIDLADNLPLDNNNLLRARDGSTLSIYGTVTDNTDGVIRAEDASTVLFRFGSVTGGALETTGSGELRTTTEDTTFIDVTLNGLFRMPNDADTVLAGTLTNNGTWAMDSAGNITDLKLNSETVTLGGPGDLTMSDNGNNRITSINAARTFVNGLGHTIRGAGQIGTNNTTVQNLGVIEADSGTQIFIDPIDNGTSFNQGTLRVSGSGGMTMSFGSWFNKGTVDIDPTRMFTRNGGYVQTDGNTIVDGTLSLPNGGYSQTGGLLSGDGVVQGNVLISGGSSSPSGADGGDLGSLNVTGTYAQDNDGGYVVDLDAAGNDLLSIGGAATLGGALQVRLVNSFVPVIGQEFLILTAASINGNFGCVEFPNAPAGYFSLVYSATQVKLVVAGKPVQEADLNFDGTVDASDLGLLLGAWGNDPCDNAICCPADLDGDGKVNGADLAILLGAWG
jgi:fibronectin-binding autotransporter adhesin